VIWLSNKKAPIRSQRLNKSPIFVGSTRISTLEKVILGMNDPSAGCGISVFLVMVEREKGKVASACNAEVRGSIPLISTRIKKTRGYGIIHTPFLLVVLTNYWSVI
jgi:hypothetical protein